MSIIIRNHEAAQVACDNCYSRAPQAETVKQALETARLDGFYTFIFWEGINAHACCPDCRDSIIAVLSGTSKPYQLDRGIN